jgi:N-succinyl-L-ornithine transcarbamylase
LWYYCRKGFFAGLVDKERQCRNCFGWFSVWQFQCVNMEGCTGHPSTSRCDNHGRTQNRTQTESEFCLGHTLKLYLKPVAITCGNDAVTKCRFCNNTSWRLQIESEIKKKSPQIEYDQEKAFWKRWFYLYQNWSSYSDYGKITNSDPNWTVTGEKMKLTNNAKFMHCFTRKT